MLNHEIFAIEEIAPDSTWLPRERVCSSRAWTFACEASFQGTHGDDPVWQDDILSVVEIGALCVVTLGRKDGSVYQVSINLDEWYAAVAS